MHRVNSKFANIKFKCVIKTKLGEVAKICGSIEEFGSWNPKNAQAMETTKDTYPIWNSTIDIILPVGMSFKYKYLIVNESTNTIQWESLAGNINREFNITTSGEFILNDEEGKGGQIFIERIIPDGDTQNEIEKESASVDEFEDEFMCMKDSIQVLCY